MKVLSDSYPFVDDRKIRILIADDHLLMRDSIRAHLENQADTCIVAEASDGEEAVRYAVEYNPDVIIMDIAMPKMNGIEATRKIKALNHRIVVLILTVHEDIEYIIKVLDCGAAGYLTKNIHGEELIHAIHLVVSGESLLSNDIMKKLMLQVVPVSSKNNTVAISLDKLSLREEQVFRLAARGMTNKEIALSLNLNLRTVKWHLVNIFSKLNVSSRTQAVIAALKAGLFSLDELC